MKVGVGRVGVVFGVPYRRARTACGTWFRGAQIWGTGTRGIRTRGTRTRGIRTQGTLTRSRGVARRLRGGRAGAGPGGRLGGGVSAGVVCVMAALVIVALAGLGAPRAHAAVASAASAPDPDVPNLAVVMAGEGNGRTTSVRSGDPYFARLWRLLGPSAADTEKVPQDWLEGRFPAVRATVIWGTTGVGGWPDTDSAPGGDIYMGRQDQVFLADDGTPWIRSDPAVDVNDDDIRWHRAPRSVYDELEGKELFGPGSVTGGAADPAGGPGWATAGLAAGLALGSGGTLLIRRAAAGREPGPPRESRQELIDL